MIVAIEQSALQHHSDGTISLNYGSHDFQHGFFIINWVVSKLTSPLHSDFSCLFLMVKVVGKEYIRLKFYTRRELSSQISYVYPYTHQAGMIFITGIVCHVTKPSGNRVKGMPDRVLNTFPCYNGNIHQARENPFIVFYQDPNSSWGPKTIALSSFFGSLHCTGCLGTSLPEKAWQCALAGLPEQPAIACVLYFHIS